MDNSSAIPPEVREQLVAYLDGELDEGATVEIERTLSESEEIRLEVESLSRTWELLDALPSVHASNQFTERTLESVHVTDPLEVTQPLFSPHIRKKLFVVTLFAGLFMFAAGGFFLANQVIPQRSDGLVQDLPVIENLDLYEEVGDVEYLRDIQALGPLNDEPFPEEDDERD